jgi:hypothetical protein
MIALRSFLFAGRLLLQYALRMAAVSLFLYFVMKHTAPDLAKTLAGWPAGYCTFLFFVQLAALRVLYELRDYFVRDAWWKLFLLPKAQMRPVLAGCWLMALAGMVPNLLLIFSCMQPWSMVLFPQTILLLGFTWVTTGYAVPLTAWRYRNYWINCCSQHTNLTIL